MPDPVKFIIEIEKGEHGLWYVTSPEIRGLFVAIRFLHRMGNEVDDAIRGLAEAGSEQCQQILKAQQEIARAEGLPHTSKEPTDGN